jgi:hypothetical protein
MTRIQATVAGIILCIIVLFGVSWCWERRNGVTPAQQDTAHAHTQAAESVAARAETVFVERQAAAAAARVIYRHDLVTKHLTDTVWVKQTLAHADTVITRDSVALVAAIHTVIAERGVSDSVRKELALALKPHYAPRFSGVAQGLYEPMTQVPVATVSGNFRVIGNLSLTTQYHQRFTPGEKPRFSAGVGIAF